ncbi:MAG: hypothetical protein A4E59_00110 [Syntrophorhabdus sp. PtaB.Bin027]|nr:MAG: hypothetical protein A4E59_00110 [Syntrophorhabdus sp. PtaB.Bin027]
MRDGEGNVIAEYDGLGNLIAEYVYGNNQRIARINSNKTIDNSLNDHPAKAGQVPGSARTMVSSSWSANYAEGIPFWDYPFGEIASQTGSAEDTHFDFTGQERDRGTGLLYFGARYLDPGIGRWLSVDPLGEIYPYFSPYLYCANNPSRYRDFEGMRLYDLNGNKINLNQALSLFNRGVNEFFAGNQQNALPNFYAKKEISDLWDTEDWRHGFKENEILIGNYKIYDAQGHSLKSMSVILINYGSRGGVFNSSKIEFVAYTKNGEKIYRFLIEDEKGQVVFAIIGTKDELDTYLALFGRNTSNSQIWYENGKQYGQQSIEVSDKNYNQEKNNKTDTSWGKGWEAENQSPPR